MGTVATRGMEALSGLVLAATLTAGALAGGGCDGDGGSDATVAFEEALPTEETLLFAFPTPGGVAIVDAALDGAEVHAAALGEPSALHETMRGTARAVNAALLEILKPLSSAMAATAPVEKTATRRVWEAVGPGGLDLYRLIVTRADDGHFEFQLWSRPVDEASGGVAAGWRGRVFGSTTPGDRAGTGRGALWIDLEADRKPGTRGKVLAVWSSLGGVREVDVSFFAATLDATVDRARTTRFTFRRDADGGRMAYGPELVNVHQRADRDALEAVTVVSRWNSSGGGRSDLVARGGDLRLDNVAVLVVSECWIPPGFGVDFDQTAARRTLAGELVVLQSHGEPSACLFPGPEIVALPEVGDEPTAPTAPE